MSKTVGVMGGLGPRATVDFLRRVIEATPAQRDQDHLHILVDNRPQVPDRTEAILRGGPSPLPELVLSANLLQQMGAELLAMPCNAAHFYYSEICRNLEVPLLHMIRLTCEVVAGKGFSRAGLLATDGTLHAQLYQQALEELGVAVTLPDGEERRRTMALIYGLQGLKAGAVLPTHLEQLSDLCQALQRRGAEVVILGCTELPLILELGKPAVEVVVSSQVLAEEVVAQAWRTRR